MVQLDDSSLIAKNDDIIFSEIDDEVVMMSLEKGEYYGVNPVGASIWKLLETPLSIGDICGRLLEEYDVGTEQCAEEVRRFVCCLLEKGIVTCVEAD